MSLQKISATKNEVINNQINDETPTDQELYGFNQIEELLKKLWQEKKFHHALLISGQKGIGKASFAKKLANDLITISLEKPNHIKNHPNILLIQKDEGKKEINVDKIRKISKFINHSGAILESKFIIIDAADELNKSSANALLKILEEPLANNFLLLISHNLNKILPTIKSRCSLIRVNNLSFEDFKKILTKRLAGQIPSDKELEFLSLISQNSPAVALSFVVEASDLYQQLIASILNKQIDPRLFKMAAEKSSNKNLEALDQQDIMSEIVNFLLKRLVFFLSNQISNFYHQEQELFTNFARKINSKKDMDRIFSLIEEITDLLNKSQYLNLDKKLVLVNIFNLICKEIA